jgi:hypothetical protein
MQGGFLFLRALRLVALLHGFGGHFSARRLPMAIVAVGLRRAWLSVFLFVCPTSPALHSLWASTAPTFI